VNARFDPNLVFSGPFREAVDELARLLMSDLQTSREPVVKEMVRLTGIEAQDARLIRALATVYLYSPRHDLPLRAATSPCSSNEGKTPFSRA
jgi:hypothetical protein